MTWTVQKVKLSKHCQVVIPKGVADEIMISPGRENLQDSVIQGVANIVDVNQSKVEQILNEPPQLHRGECAATDLMQTASSIKLHEYG